MQVSKRAPVGDADQLRLSPVVQPLVSPPTLQRRLPVRPASVSGRFRNPSPSTGGWSLLAAHGGAGVSSLQRSGAGGEDAQRIWPSSGLVVVVARRTAYGLEWARDAARQHASGCAPAGVELAGLVVVADAPGRVPKRLAAFLDLVCGAYPRVWEVPWVEEWRLAGHGEPLPTPPAVQQLHIDMQALTGVGTHQEKE